MRGTFPLCIISLVISLCMSTLCSSKDLASLCTASIYSDNTLTQRAERFSIYDEVYLRVYCKALPKGTYKISTQWMDERGRLQSERVHTAGIGFPRGHSASFKFKQMPQGSVQRMTSGKDFEEYQFGRWSVLTYINNEEIGRNYFTITE